MNHKGLFKFVWTVSAIANFTAVEMNFAAYIQTHHSLHIWLMGMSTLVLLYAVWRACEA